MIELMSGDARLLLCPEIGGAIGGWTRKGIPVLRTTPPEALSGFNSRALSCFPLIPFSNRIAWGRFSFGGETFQLAQNFGDHPHTIHGNAWQRKWTTKSRTSEEAVLALNHDPASDPTAPPGVCHWPYRYYCTLRYRLKPDGLTVDFHFENRDSRPQPVGLGLHPYQPRTAQTALAFMAGSVWHTGVDSLPDQRLQVEGHWSFDPGHRIDGPALDNCFCAWTGRAEIMRPEHGIVLTIAGDDLFRHLVVYTPDNKPYFAVEPASNMTDAVNRMDSVPDHGLRVLRPGQVLERQVRFSIRDC